MFIGKPQELWCSILNISCEGKTLKTREIVKSPGQYVWFENEERNVEESLFEEKILTENQLCPRVSEFVWFDESENESKDIIETLPDDVIESDLDKLMEKVIKSSSNLLI